MFTYIPWLLYGATGRTGTLIAEEAVARGHRPVLAGRDPAALRSLAERLDLTWVAGPVTDLARLIGDAGWYCWPLVRSARPHRPPFAPAWTPACTISTSPTTSRSPPRPWPRTGRLAAAASPRSPRSGSERWPVTGWPGTWRTRSPTRSGSSWRSCSAPTARAPARRRVRGRPWPVVDASATVVAWSADRSATGPDDWS